MPVLEESRAPEPLPVPPSAPLGGDSSRGDRRLLGIGLLLIALLLAGMSVYFGYLQYTSPLTALDRKAHEALEQDIQRGARAQGYTVQMEPYEEIGLIPRIIFQPTSLIALGFLIVGIGLVLPPRPRDREETPPWEREAAGGSDSAATVGGVQHARQADAPEWPD